MAASLTTLLLLSLCPLLSVSEAQHRQQITAHPGEDVTLSCQARNNVAIATVEWSRPDLDRHVYMKRDGHLETADQDPSYVNRVQLENDEMKNGDLSLVLKKVRSTDNGTYECRYVKEGGGRRKRADARKLRSIVQLKVEGPGGGDQERGGQTGGDEEGGGQRGSKIDVILATLTAVVAVAGLIVGVVIYKKRRGRSENNADQPGDDPDVLQQLQQNETSQRNITPNTSDIQV